MKVGDDVKYGSKTGTVAIVDNGTVTILWPMASGWTHPVSYNADEIARFGFEFVEEVAETLAQEACIAELEESA